jgi:hypothetical protein
MGNLLIFGFDLPENRNNRPPWRQRLIKLRYQRAAAGNGILGVEPVDDIPRCSRGKINATRKQVPG